MTWIEFQKAQRARLKEYVAQSLVEAGSISEAADKVGMPRRTMQRFMDEFGMPRGSFVRRSKLHIKEASGVDT